MISSDDSMKIILLGNSGVGKTSLANRWINNQFDPNAATTICASNCSKSVFVDDRQSSVTIWDTAGQEQFRSITPLYIRGAKGVIIVISLDDNTTYKSIGQWLDMLNILDDRSIPVILAGNKCDCCNISDDDFKEIYAPYKDSFTDAFIVSALSGENVDNLFTSISCLAIRHSQKKSDTMQTIQVAEPPKNDSCC